MRRWDLGVLSAYLTTDACIIIIATVVIDSLRAGVHAVHDS